MKKLFLRRFQKNIDQNKPHPVGRAACHAHPLPPVSTHHTHMSCRPTHMPCAPTATIMRIDPPYSPPCRAHSCYAHPIHTSTLLLFIKHTHYYLYAIFRSRRKFGRPAPLGAVYSDQCSFGTFLKIAFSFL